MRLVERRIVDRRRVYSGRKIADNARGGPMSTHDKRSRDEMQERRSPTAEPEVSDSGLDLDRDGIVGAVDGSARDSAEATSSDPVTSAARGREEARPGNAAGLSPDDPDDGEARKRAYRDGATLVSRID
jgi:hypothetical protein